MAITDEQVAAASAAWIWVPDNAETVETEEYLLVRFPEWADADLVLLRFEPTRPVADVLAEVLAHATLTGRPELAFWVKLGAPDVLEPMLVQIGGRLEETVDVLAVDLADAMPDVGAGDVDVRWISDVETLRASYTVLAEVFGGAVPPDDRLQLEAWQTAADHEGGHGGGVVAFLDGVPVGTGGVTLADGVVRLWSWSVLEAARGRGVYRAMLAARLRYGVERGASMGLVKGRVETSGPILRRAGFVAHGQERCYAIPLG